MSHSLPNRYINLSHLCVRARARTHNKAYQRKGEKMKKMQEVKYMIQSAQTLNQCTRAKWSAWW